MCVCGYMCVCGGGCVCSCVRVYVHVHFLSKCVQVGTCVCVCVCELGPSYRNSEHPAKAYRRFDGALCIRILAFVSCSTNDTTVTGAHFSILKHQSHVLVLGQWRTLNM